MVRLFLPQASLRRRTQLRRAIKAVMEPGCVLITDRRMSIRDNAGRETDQFADRHDKDYECQYFHAATFPLGAFI